MGVVEAAVDDRDVETHAGPGVLAGSAERLNGSRADPWHRFGEVKLVVGDRADADDISHGAEIVDARAVDGDCEAGGDVGEAAHNLTAQGGNLRDQGVLHGLDFEDVRPALLVRPELADHAERRLVEVHDDLNGSGCQAGRRLRPGLIDGALDKLEV